MLVRRSMLVAGVLLTALLLWGQGPVVMTYTLIPKREVFRVKSQTVTLASPPAVEAYVGVYVNGVLMLDGEDYTITKGDIVTFSKQVIGDFPIIQVMYWTRSAQ